MLMASCLGTGRWNLSEFSGPQGSPLVGSLQPSWASAGPCMVGLWLSPGRSLWSCDRPGLSPEGSSTSCAPCSREQADAWSIAQI
jgi:hypothetical protein